MNTDATTPYPPLGDRLRERLTNLTGGGPNPLDVTGCTDPSEAHASGYAWSRSLGPVRQVSAVRARAVTLLFRVMRATAGGDVSRSVPVIDLCALTERYSVGCLPPQACDAADILVSLPAVYPEADCYRPVEFEWTLSNYEVRRALKGYSEATYADR